MSHRRLAVSPPPYDIGINRQKDNPMLKAHKIALDPNNVQATQFAQHCGYARVAYNHALADFKQGLAEGNWRSHIDLSSWGTNRRIKKIAQSNRYWSVYHKNPKPSGLGAVKYLVSVGGWRQSSVELL